MIFNELISTLNRINEELKEQSIRAVNMSLTLRNWFFGFYILEFEQNGKDRAEYGKSLIANIANELISFKIPNTDARELARYRLLYISYPEAGKFMLASSPILETASPKLEEIDIKSNDMRILGTLSPKSNTDNLLNSIRQSVTAELNQDIRGTVNPEFAIPDAHYLNLFKSISYSHFVELIRIEDPYMRLFYEIECMKGVWSVRELKRQIGSLLYERTGLSTKKEKLIALTQAKANIQTPTDIIRDPYVFEFLGLKPSEVIAEGELEQALTDHLLKFILELGRGFCFEARQKRILIDNEHYFIDLVFYHRLLHCNILIELKTERFNHAHAGQMNMYLEYYKKYEMAEGDNPPVGILLCTNKDHEHVEFATAGLDDKLFVSKYLVALPEKKQLEDFIKKELKK